MCVPASSWRRFCLKSGCTDAPASTCAGVHCAWSVRDCTVRMEWFPAGTCCMMQALLSRTRCTRRVACWMAMLLLWECALVQAMHLVPPCSCRVCSVGVQDSRKCEVLLPSLLLPLRQRCGSWVSTSQPYCGCQVPCAPPPGTMHNASPCCWLFWQHPSCRLWLRASLHWLVLSNAGCCLGGRHCCTHALFC